MSGVRDPDGKLGEMMDLKEQCNKLNADYPQQLVDYFDGTDVLDSGGDRDYLVRMATEVGLKYGGLKIDGLVEGDVEYGDGMTIDLPKLPDDIKKLRVYMA